MRVEDLIRALPKVEQHIHIVGSIRHETVIWLAKEGGMDLPFQTAMDVQRFFQYRDFSHFISIYSTMVDCITDEEQLERITYEMLQDEAKCNVQYVEASFSVLDHIHKGLDYGRMIDAISRGMDRAFSDFGVKCDLRIDLVRNYGPEAGLKVLEWITDENDNIISIDIGGSEEKFPPKPFAPVFRRAKKMGLHLAAHAGEAAGPESIWDAVKYLDVEHIGHGVAAQYDPRLLDYIRKHRIAIEMCPISNLRTRVVPSLKKHPIRDFFDRRVMVTVNSDDPSMFNTNLNNEYLQLHRELGFTVSELFQLSLNAVDSSFLVEEQKTKMRESFKREYERLVDNENENMS